MADFLYSTFLEWHVMPLSLRPWTRVLGTRLRLMMHTTLADLVLRITDVLSVCVGVRDEAPSAERATQGCREPSLISRLPRKTSRAHPLRCIVTPQARM
jgi:hypothetical protein